MLLCSFSLYVDTMVELHAMDEKHSTSLSLLEVKVDFIWNKGLY